MEKEELNKLLVEAEGEREYYRVKYINAFIFDGEYDAKFHQWNEKVKELKRQLNVHA